MFEGIISQDSNIKRAGERELFNALKSSGVNVSSVDDIKPVQRGKLLINLNNPLNALFGQPITVIHFQVFIFYIRMVSTKVNMTFIYFY